MFVDRMGYDTMNWDQGEGLMIQDQDGSGGGDV
jgi:hypothetical protein